MLHDVDDPADVVQILDLRFAVTARARVNHVHGRAGGPEIHPPAPRLHVVTGILTVQHEAPAGPRQRVLDQRRREQQAAGLGHDATCLGQYFDSRGWSIGKPDLCQQSQGCAVNLDDVRLAQRAIAATFHPGPYRLEIVRQGPRAQGTAGVAVGARPPGGSRDLSHAASTPCFYFDRPQ